MSTKGGLVSDIGNYRSDPSLGTPGSNKHLLPRFIFLTLFGTFLDTFFGFGFAFFASFGKCLFAHSVCANFGLNAHSPSYSITLLK